VVVDGKLYTRQWPLTDCRTVWSMVTDYSPPPSSPLMPPPPPQLLLLLHPTTASGLRAVIDAEACH
jgi:hypothetical protein